MEIWAKEVFLFMFFFLFFSLTYITKTLQYLLEVGVRISVLYLSERNNFPLKKIPLLLNAFPQGK